LIRLELGLERREGKRGFFEITRATISQIGAVVNRNLLLVRYSLERVAKSFKTRRVVKKMGWKGNYWEDPEQKRGAGQASQGHGRSCSSWSGRLRSWLLQR
jgi:hypothetical protein